MEIPVKILIVDDDDVSRDLIREIIEGEKCVEVVLASDGVEALEKLQGNPADMLITDLNMPRMDGLKLLSHARQLYPHIVSIIITGFGSLESAIEAIRQGAYDYVQKPFKIERMALVARNAIEKISILREKTRLINELDEVYRRLHSFESECRTRPFESAGSGPEGMLEGPYPLFPHNGLPIHLLDVPTQSSLQVLAKLERLGELKRDGIIDEQEFLALKKAIIHQLGTK